MKAGIIINYFLVLIRQAQFSFNRRFSGTMRPNSIQAFAENSGQIKGLLSINLECPDFSSGLVVEQRETTIFQEEMGFQGWMQDFPEGAPAKKVGQPII